MQKALLKALLLLCLGSVYSAQTAADITFTLVEAVNSSDDAVQRNGHVGINISLDIIKTWYNGTSTTIAETGVTLVPDGGGATFPANDFFYTPTIDGDGNIIVRSSLGIYKTVGGVLTTVADKTTAVPGGAIFNVFRNGSGAQPAHSIDQGFVAFVAQDTNNLDGIYTDLGGTLQKVVDENTFLPDSITTTFSGFRTGVDISNSNIFFGALAGTIQGVYHWHPTNGLSVVADETTLCPGGTGTMNFGDPNLDADDDKVVFITAGGSSGCSNQLLVTNINSSLEAIAERAVTPTPGGSGTLLFNGDNYAIDGNRIVLCAEDFGGSGLSSIFKWESGSWTRLFGEGDIIGGKEIVSLGFTDTCGIGRNSLSGDLLVIEARIDDGTNDVSGVYLVNLNASAETLPTENAPLPLWSLVFLAMLLLLTVTIKRRSYR